MATKQIGGWYWNPATNKSEQYWGDQQQATPNYQDAYKSIYDPMASQVNKYADELIAKANGDYDYAAKWLESNYKVALGTDDAQRAQFLKQVASDLENKVGRIAYDYQTGKYRSEQDLQTGTQRLTENKNIALQRLAQDEQAYKQSFERQLGQTRQAENAALNERGLMTGTRETVGGLGRQEINTTEATAADTLAAYQRALQNNQQDIGNTFSRGLQDLQTGTQRGIEDLTTNARRGGIDQTNTYNQGLEQAARAREQARLEAEAERTRQLDQARLLANRFGEKGVSSGTL